MEASGPSRIGFPRKSRTTIHQIGGKALRASAEPARAIGPTSEALRTLRVCVKLFVLRSSGASGNWPKSHAKAQTTQRTRLEVEAHNPRSNTKSNRITRINHGRGILSLLSLCAARGFAFGLDGCASSATPQLSQEPVRTYRAKSAKQFDDAASNVNALVPQQRQTEVYRTFGEFQETNISKWQKN